MKSYAGRTHVTSSASGPLTRRAKHRQNGIVAIRLNTALNAKMVRRLEESVGALSQSLCLGINSFFLWRADRAELPEH
jgi:hypothetical protein